MDENTVGPAEHADQPTGGPNKQRKPYRKPAVRHERVFETRALMCGKVQTTQSTCQHQRKTS
jgi:hypothetical protein